MIKIVDLYINSIDIWFYMICMCYVGSVAPYPRKRLRPRQRAQRTSRPNSQHFITDYNLYIAIDQLEKSLKNDDNPQIM